MDKFKLEILMACKIISTSVSSLPELISALRRVNQDGVFQVPKVYLAPKELLASRERRVALDHLVFPDRKVTQDHQAFRESKVLQDN